MGRHRRFGDPEVLSDLRERHLTASGDRDHILPELPRKSFRHDQHPSSGDRNHHTSGVTSTLSSPVSELLHVRNPFAKPRTPEDYLEQLLSLTEKFRDLLNWHLVQLADSSEYLYLRNLDGEIKVQAFRTENPLL